MTMQDYTLKTVYCKQAGLTQEQARLSLLESANIVGTHIARVYEDKGRWAADLFVPKVASPPFPPDNDNEESDSLPKPTDNSGESPSSDGPPSDEGGDDSGPPKSEGGDKPGGDKPKTDGKGEGGGEVVSLLHQILDMLMGGSMPPGPGAGVPSPHPAGPPGAGGGPGGPPGIGGPPKPPMGAGGPPGAGAPPPGGPHVQEVIHKRVLKPGEAPPGTLPVGAPALSHTTSLNDLNSVTATTDGSQVTLAQAKADLDNKFSKHGFKVAQIKRLDDGSDKIAALLSRR